MIVVVVFVAIVPRFFGIKEEILFFFFLPTFLCLYILRWDPLDSLSSVVLLIRFCFDEALYDVLPSARIYIYIYIKKK